MDSDTSHTKPTKDMLQGKDVKPVQWFKRIFRWGLKLVLRFQRALGTDNMWEARVYTRGQWDLTIWSHKSKFWLQEEIWHVEGAKTMENPTEKYVCTEHTGPDATCHSQESWRNVTQIIPSKPSDTTELLVLLFALLGFNIDLILYFCCGFILFFFNGDVYFLLVDSSWDSPNCHTC